MIFFAWWGVLLARAARGRAACPASSDVIALPYLGDHQVRMAHAEPEPHVVDHRRRVGAEPLRVVRRPLVDQGRGDLELVGARLRNLHANRPHVYRPGCRGIAHRVDATSLRAARSSAWMAPFEAVSDGGPTSCGRSAADR